MNGGTAVRRKSDVELREFETPNRLVREGLLDSDRYWSATIEARQLFVHMLLLADDTGCISVSPTFLRRRCFNDSPPQERISKLLNELQDVDLVRLYDHDRACYAFIPRFGQRLQRTTLKHPPPPESLYQDDEHAKKLFNDINNKTKNPTVGKPLATCGQPPEEKRREVKRREVKHLASNAVALSAEDVVISIPLNDNSEHPISKSLLAELEVLYPAVDVPQTLREIRGWNLANPGKRKTRSGVLRHVNSWLAKEQNRG